ncbi:stress response protein [Kitasatospora sp. CB02891]|nr:stress response protein [Kitasatospora sp. CB02891]
MGETVAVTARSLAKGSNLPIDVPAVHADLTWTPAPGVPDLSAAALLLTADGQARDASDLIRRHRPTHRSGAVLHRGRTGGAEAPVERIEADLAALDVRDAAVQRVLLLAATGDDGTFGRVPDLTLLISDARTGLPLARFVIEAGRETALIGGELYRRGGQWKFRAVAQGWANGLNGVAAAYGFDLPAEGDADADVDMDVDVADGQVPALGAESASAPVPGPRAAAEPVPTAVPTPEPAADATGGLAVRHPVEAAESESASGHGSVPEPARHAAEEAGPASERGHASVSQPAPEPTADVTGGFGVRHSVGGAGPTSGHASVPEPARRAAEEALPVTELESAPEFGPGPGPDATRELRLRPASLPEPRPEPATVPQPALGLRPAAEPVPEPVPVPEPGREPGPVPVAGLGPDATRELRLRPADSRPESRSVVPAPVPGPVEVPPPTVTQPLSSPHPSASPAVPPRPAHAPDFAAAAEEHLPVDMRKRLSLRKQQVAVSLRKHGAQGVVARILLVLDASGSMAGLYGRGVVADVVERMAAVAAQLDDDGTMQAWTFATKPARLPDLSLPGLPEWLRLHVRPGEANMSLFGRRRVRPPLPDGRVDMRAVGIQNEEQKVIAEVRAFVHAHPSPLPTLVLFFSDGGVYRNSEIEAQLRAAVEEPIFWQFVGLGHSNYGVLEYFDQLPGRRVDNVGFFAVDDISTLPDPELYDRLLSEFPQWIAAARRIGILG